MNDGVLSLSTIVDCLTARIEWADDAGLLAERDALIAARERIMAHVYHEDRHRTILASIVDRLMGRRWAA